MERRREHFVVASVVSVVVGLGCSPPDTSTGEVRAVRPVMLLTAQQCTAAAVNGKVGLCHATGSVSNPYVHIEVATSACINAHAKRHADDFISDDPNCARCGDGVVTVGETCDPSSTCPTGCDDGDACTVDLLTGSAESCNSACSHTAYECADTLACTTDICNGDGTCTFAVNPGNCVAEGVCHAGGHGPVDPDPNPPTSNQQVGMSLAGEYVGIDVSWDGRFTIGALQPSPWDLLYGWPGFPWSTGATIRVDSEVAHFGEDINDSEFLQYPYDAGHSISVAVWRMGPIVITQTLRIVTSSTTGAPDVIKAQYDLVNTDTEPHDTSLRLLLDTEINAYDGAPFRVPGQPNPITTETEFYGADVPQRYEAFVDLGDPVHVIEGSLKGGDLTPPDRFALVSWNDAANADWDYAITPGAPFGSSYVDSGVLLYWNPQTLGPGMSRRIVSAYGLGALTGSPALAISGPTRLGLSENAWSPNPFTVMAYLKNTDSVTQDGESLTLSFGETGGLAFDAGESATHALPSIPAGETVGSAWHVVPLASGVWTYRVSKTSSPETWAERQVTVPQPWTCVRAKD